jgi:predicted nucleic acid-binding protein
VLLVDSSVWIETFRKPSRLEFASIADLSDVVTCLPIIQEVLQGFRDERAFRIAREAMWALPIIESPLRSEVFTEAIHLYRQARHVGLTIRSGVDCLIAVVAIRHSLVVLHHNRDFEALAKVSPLEAREVLRPGKLRS